MHHVYFFRSKTSVQRTFLLKERNWKAAYENPIATGKEKKSDIVLMTLLRYDDDTIHRNGCLFGAPAIRIIIIRGEPAYSACAITNPSFLLIKTSM